MELFSEIYSLYYRAVEEVLRQAQVRPLSGGEIQKILSDCTFSESALTILPKLQSNAWPLIQKMEGGYTTACVPPVENPITNLQKAWLKSILSDPRIHLFFDESEIEQIRQALSDVTSLYHQDDFYAFDKASDGDAYDSATYQSHFRAVLLAIRKKEPLFVQYEGSKGSRVSGIFWPYKMEYSQKDDKFRAYCYRNSKNRKVLYTLNLARIVLSEPFPYSTTENAMPARINTSSQLRQVVIEITRERNALERCMVHFAHFEKQTEYDKDSDKYICTIRYHASDETEVLIRVLSFGPTIRVIAPEEFICEIRDRVKKQSELIRLADWYKDEQPKAKIKNAIMGALDTDLPESYERLE